MTDLRQFAAENMAINTLTQIAQQEFDDAIKQKIIEIFHTAFQKPLSDNMLKAMQPILHHFDFDFDLETYLIAIPVSDLAEQDYQSFLKYISLFYQQLGTDSSNACLRVAAEKRDLETFKYVTTLLVPKEYFFDEGYYYGTFYDFVSTCLVTNYLDGLRWLAEESEFSEDLFQITTRLEDSTAIFESYSPDSENPVRYLLNVVYDCDETYFVELANLFKTGKLSDLDPKPKNFTDVCRDARLKLISIFREQNLPFDNFPAIFRKYFSNSSTRKILESELNNITLEDLDKQFSSPNKPPKKVLRAHTKI